MQSMPSSRSILVCVRRIVVSEPSAHSCFSALKHCRASVPRPDAVRVRTTRYFFSPIAKVKMIEPLFVPSRTQPPMSSLRVCSYRQSAIASINSEDLPTPFAPLTIAM